jgi:hypothetical protein
MTLVTFSTLGGADAQAATSNPTSKATALFDSPLNFAHIPGTNRAELEYITMKYKEGAGKISTPNRPGLLLEIGALSSLMVAVVPSTYQMPTVVKQI